MSTKPCTICGGNHSARLHVPGFFRTNDPNALLARLESGIALLTEARHYVAGTLEGKQAHLVERIDEWLKP